MAVTATLSHPPLPLAGSPQLRAPDPWARLAAGVLDLLDESVLVIARDFQLLGANRAAAALLREGDGLATVQRGIVASTPAATFELRRGIERTAHGEVRRLQVPRSGRTPLSLLVEPHPSKQSGVGAAVVFASDPERRAARPEALNARYGFTPTECEVARRLAAGSGLVAIAEALGITLNTVRGHLKHLYMKAGVHRQAELVAKLLSGA